MRILRRNFRTTEMNKITLFRILGATTINAVLHFGLFLCLILSFSDNKNSSGGWIGSLPSDLVFKLNFLIALLVLIFIGIPSGFILSLVKINYFNLLTSSIILSVLSGIVIALSVNLLGHTSNSKELLKFFTSFFILPTAISFFCNIVTSIILIKVFGNQNGNN